MKINKNLEYLKERKEIQRLVRTEIIFTPILIIFPLIVGFSLIYEWYYRGFLLGNNNFDVELLLGIIIIFGNLLFDIPFIKSLIIAVKELSIKK